MEEADGDPEREQLKKDCDTVMHYTQIKPLALSGIINMNNHYIAICFYPTTPVR